MSRLADKRLQDLTNEFLKQFFELAHQANIDESKENPKLYPEPKKRNDSFEFNYTLAECLSYSDFAVKQCETRDDYPLIGSGFQRNIIKHFFNNSIKGIKDDVVFVIDNFKKQDKNLDYFVKSLKDNTEKKMEKKINVDYILKRSTEPHKMVEETHRKVSFTIHNSKSGYDGYCEVLFVDGEIEDINVYDSTKKNLQVSIKHSGEAEIHQFRYTPDINGFFLMIEQVKYGIEDMLKEEKEKKNKKA